MGKAKCAMVSAPAAGQQNSLAPVIVGVTQLTLILIEIDQVVSGEGQAVDVRHFQLILIFHNAIVRPI